MHVSLGSDRFGLNSHACTSALRCTGPVRSSDRPARWNCCTCSAAASVSGTGDEEPQLVGFGCIGQATRAARHAYRLMLSQAQRPQASQLTDRSILHQTGECTSGSVRYSYSRLLAGVAVKRSKVMHTQRLTGVVSSVALQRPKTTQPTLSITWRCSVTWQGVCGPWPKLRLYGRLLGVVFSAKLQGTHSCLHCCSTAKLEQRSNLW